MPNMSKNNSHMSFTFWFSVTVKQHGQRLKQSVMLMLSSESVVWSVPESATQVQLRSTTSPTSHTLRDYTQRSRQASQGHFEVFRTVCTLAVCVYSLASHAHITSQCNGRLHSVTIRSNSIVPPLIGSVLFRLESRPLNRHPNTTHWRT
jgi:hypothetical protein